MGYIPHEKMTVEQINAEIDSSFSRWNAIKENGCQDPSYPDGVNMNLLRNHIIYWYQILNELETNGETQLSMFDAAVERKPVPPLVPNSYMAPNGKYSHRLDRSPFWPNVVREI